MSLSEILAILSQALVRGIYVPQSSPEDFSARSCTVPTFIPSLCCTCLDSDLGLRAASLHGRLSASAT